MLVPQEGHPNYNSHSVMPFVCIPTHTKTDLPMVNKSRRFISIASLELYVHLVYTPDMENISINTYVRPDRFSAEMLCYWPSLS